ncbi:MAG: type II toxin-antitoxin system PemK/MazF family toxin [Propionibacteriaceae bacterium]|jgi:mRNA interferase MazF|nr:type II toxin-antitoxin system PemK/MazF family toxin [Propionibacteriaceae bacterium]
MKQSSDDLARRGEVWLAGLGAAKSGELGKNRPVLVLSVDWVSTDAPDEPVIVVPYTSARAVSPLRPKAPVGIGMELDSVALCRAVRSISRNRLLRRLGKAPEAHVELVAALVSAMVGGPRDPEVILQLVSDVPNL